MSMKKRLIAGLIVFVSLAGSAHAQTEEKAPAHNASVPKPTLAEVRYGEHERHILDFWKAPSDTPTPLVFVIHGGAWVNGSKKVVSRLVDIEALLKADISVVSINYRLIMKMRELKTKESIL